MKLLSPRTTLVVVIVGLCFILASAGEHIAKIGGPLHWLFAFIGGACIVMAGAGRSIIPFIDFGPGNGSPKPSPAAASSPSTKETPQMANQPVDAVASLLKNLLESDKPQALALIQSAEGGAQAFIVNALRNTKLSGVQGMLYKILEPKLEDGVAQLIAKNGPEVVFDFIDAFLAKESVA